MRVLLTEERKQVLLQLLATRLLRFPLGVLGSLGVAMTLEFAFTLLLKPSEAVLLVDQLRHCRDSTARLKLVVRIAGGEIVEFGYTLENLASLPQSAIAQL